MVVLALAASAAPVPSTSAPARDESPGTRPYHCTTRTGGGVYDYPGPAASTTYDKRFGPGPRIPHLRTHVPQGLAYWAKKRWFLVSAYADGNDQSLIIAISRRSGKTVGSVRIAEGHVGGIAVGRGFAYVADSHSGVGTVRRYRLSTLAKKVHERGMPFLRMKSIRRVKASSFVAVHGRSLWVGKFNEDDYGRMYRYRLHRNGHIGHKKASVSIPRKTQGVAVTGEFFYFSTSYGQEYRSNIYVQRRSDKKTRCFRAPSMSEGVTRAGRRIYVAYESGARKYTDGVDPRNVIKRLHRAPVSSLKSLKLSS